MRIFARLGFLILLAEVLPLSGLAQIYCVRAGATGANSGSDWNNAFSSLPSTLQRGATYYVADGSYGAWSLATANSGTTYITIKKATVSDHGTSTGWSDTYGDGQATMTSLDFWTSYWILDGARRNEANWDDSASYGFKLASYAEVGIADMQHDVTVKHLDVGGQSVGSQAGFRLVTWSTPYKKNITISHCNIHDVGIQIFSRFTEYLTATNTLFARNYSKECVSHQYGGNWTFANCKFIDMGLGSGPDTLTAVIGMFEFSGGGSQVPSSTLVQNGKIHGCLFARTQAAVVNDALIQIISTGWRVYNNTIVDPMSAGPDYLLNFNNGSDNEIKNNLFYNVSPSVSGPVTVDRSWVNGSHSLGGTVYVGNENPFENSAAGDYRLKTVFTGTSPKDLGLNLGSPYNVDAYGTTRGQNGAWDIGAYEFAPSGPDTTPPVVSGVAALSITTNSAIISFTTSESARSGVEYGTTTSYGGTATNSTLSMNHSLPLNGLTPNTTYHYRVHATDASGNRTTSADFTFQTSQIPPPDTNAPVITGVSVQGLTANLATIVFSTSEAARSGVEYGTTTGYGSNATNATPASTHTLSLSGLLPTTLYHYRVHATDASGNHAQTADLTFQTVDVDLVSPTVSLTAPGAGSVVSNTVTLSAAASDNVGVAGVVFLVDGTVVGIEDTTAPYSLAWDTRGVANGAHAVTARARDAAGNQTTSIAVSITVGNAALPGQFNVGDRVMVNISPTLRVRSSATISGAVIGEQAVGVLGIVAAGPVSADGYTWWQINYDNAPDGWSIQGEATSPWLVAVSSAPPAPPQMRTAQVTP